jgi:DNA polymerase III epsilon subunit-like protein
MTRILIFDTETTGLPEKYASIRDYEKWPYIIQLSYIIYDTSNNSLHTISDNYIKIDKSINISEESEKITGISREILNSKGINIKQALYDFNNALKISDIIVGHNVSFDKQIVMVECFRNKINNNFVRFHGKNIIRKPEYCTCKKSSHLFNNRYQKLENLYSNLFNEIPGGLHNSLIDTIVTFRCYYKLAHNKDIYVTNPEILNYIK